MKSVLPLLLETTPNYSLVFGRHWGVLHHVSGNTVTKRSDKREPRPDGKCLYAESMSGGCSYFSFAQEAFAKAEELSTANKTQNRDILQLAEAALMRVVIIDERVQEGFIKANAGQLLAIAEQQMFVGYLQISNCSLGDFDQKAPKGSNVTKTGYVTVNIKNEGDCVSVNNIMLKRKWKNEDTGCNLLWQSRDPFQPDILIIHQGILDQWVKKCPVQPTSEDIDRYNPKGERSETRAKIGLLIEALQRKIPHVIITSGRGEPNEMPAGVKFIPLSAFDTKPHGSMYEKFPLVQQIMSIVAQEAK